MSPLQSNKPAATTPARPWVGTFVHVVEQVAGKPVCRAALVTAYGPTDRINLTMVTPVSIEVFTDVALSDDRRKVGTWHPLHG